jgi:hypothetical protein
MIKLRNTMLPLFLILALLVSGCSPSTPATSPTPDGDQAPSNQQDASTDTDDNLPADTFTEEPEFVYSGQGETLAVVQSIMDGPHRVLLVDPLGLGSHEVQLPDEAQLPFPPGLGLSPDGAFYAYYTGSPEAGDLALVIYGLMDERVMTEIQLLSSDYPDNFQELADEMADSGAVPADLAQYDEADYAYHLQGAFEYRIETLGWSPQGRYLAFSGQMEGLSSDLYVLDTQTMGVNRLTSGPGMMQRLSWSPDGHWIIHASAYILAAGTGLTNHAASRDGSDVVSFPANVGLIDGEWLTNNLFLVHDSANGPGSHDLALLDARTGSVATLFEGAFRSYAYDPASNTILLQSEPFFDADPARGLYRIDASEPYQLTHISDTVFNTLVYIGLDGYPFAGHVDGGGLALIGLDGSMKLVADLSWFPYPAPTENLLALRYFPRNEGFWIYDADSDQSIDVTEESVFRLTWRPDSAALFYVSNSELHIFMLDNGENIQLYTWSENSMSDIDFKWVILP